MKRIVCIWKEGSSNKDNPAVRQLPQKCKDRKCTGEFDSFKLAFECKNFILNLPGDEKKAEGD
jgi:hypothetical protein